MTKLPDGLITFLFTDVQDSTQLWEQKPAAMRQALTRHDEIIENLTEQQGGFLVRPRGEGDSRFAVFEHAIDGVTAAAAIQKALFKEVWPDEIRLSVRMALHTGESEFRSGDYYGTAVNRCARLRGIAYGGQTLLSQRTYEQVRDLLPSDLAGKDLGEQQLKGLERPERVYQLVSSALPDNFPPINTDQPDMHSALAELPRHIPAFMDNAPEAKQDAQVEPLFVARELELIWLNGYLDSAMEGNSQVVFIAGGPGRGKTALISEFSRKAIKRYPKLLYAIGNCHAYSDVGDPYLPFRDVMGMLTGDLESHWTTGTINTRQAKNGWKSIPDSVKSLVDHGPHLPGIFVEPKMLLSRAVSAAAIDEPWISTLIEMVNRQTERIDGLDQSNLFEQYTNMLRNLAVSHPLLLVLDDMQWADNASISLLFHLGRRIQGVPVMIVCSYRPAEIALGRSSLQYHSEQSERHPLAKVLNEFKRQYGDVILDLGQVGVNEGRAFVDAYLDSQPNRLNEGFRSALFNHTAGHPLFTIELLRSMQERGDLMQKGGFWIAQSSLDWNTMPGKVEGVIQERLNRLEDEFLEILTVASVEGVIFSPQVLSKVQSVTERQLLRQLSRELESRHRLVKEQEGVAVGQRWLARYRFSHALLQQHIYNNISQGERRILHRTIGKILEEFYGENVRDIAVQLTHHFRGDRSREFKYARMAGEQAARQFANHEALAYLSQALLLTTTDDVLERYELLLTRESVYDLLGERDLQRKDLETLRSLIPLMEETGIGPGWAEVESRWAGYNYHTNYPDAESLAERAVKLAISEGNYKVAVKAYLIWSTASRMQGAYEEATQQVEEGIKIARKFGDLRGEGLLLNVLGLITSEQKDTKAAKAILEQALAIAQETGELQNEAQPLNNLGIIFGNQGDYSTAFGYYKQALKIAREIGNRRGECLVLGNLGWVECITGDFASGEKFFTQQRVIANELGDRYLETYIAVNLCMSTLAQGDYETALDCAQLGLDLTSETGDLSGKAWSLTFLGHTYLERDEYSQAKDAYQESYEIRNQLNQPNLAVEPLAGLARLYLTRGDISSAQEMVDRIMSFLDSGGSLDGTEEPLRVMLTCYQVYDRLKDSRAFSILENAYAELNTRAEKISDDGMRQKFIENIPYHSQIDHIWRELNGEKE
jgi:predicted ATPase/class 3 adenylate cyclase